MGHVGFKNEPHCCGPPTKSQVDIPVPQIVEEVVHVPVTQTQARQRLSDRVQG